MILDTALGSRNRVKLLRTLFAEDGLSGRRLSSLAGVSPSAAKAALEELMSAGLVLRSGGPGKFQFELNRVNHLYPQLEELFMQEGRIPGKVAELVGRYLRTCDSPLELVGIGLSLSGRVGIALKPRNLIDKKDLSPLVNQLKSQFNLESDGFAESLDGLRGYDLVWSPTDEGRIPTGFVGRERARAMRFFGIAKTRSEKAAGDK